MSEKIYSKCEYPVNDRNFKLGASSASWTLNNQLLQLGDGVATTYANDSATVLEFQLSESYIPLDHMLMLKCFISLATGGTLKSQPIALISLSKLV